jgi:phosphoglycolate phosphatase
MYANTFIDWELVLIDLDGTLIDSEEAIVSALEFAISNYPRNPKNSTPLKNLMGQPLNQILSTFLLPEHLVEAAQLYRDTFMKNLKKRVKLFDGVEDCLKRMLENRIKLIIVTNRDSITTKKILQELGIDSFFIGIFGSDLGTPKPSDDLVNKAITFARARTLATVFIGDTKIDYQAAQKAGVSFILFDPTKTARKNLRIDVNSLNNWHELTTLY